MQENLGEPSNNQETINNEWQNILFISKNAAKYVPASSVAVENLEGVGKLKLAVKSCISQ